MKSISDYNNPFDAIDEFEQALAHYTGAPFVVAVDCCTHAIELTLRYLKEIEEFKEPLNIPKHTYLSVPMTLQLLNIDYKWIDSDWHGEYQLNPLSVWDSARTMHRGMYRQGHIQCLSFGRTKPIEIGRGGAILLDDEPTYHWLKRACYDGRDLSHVPWAEQQVFHQGYHYMMRPEECVDGLNILESENFLEQKEKFYNYPDCSELHIVP